MKASDSHLLSFAVAIVGAGSLATGAWAQAVDKPPNLTPFPASNISLVSTVSGTSTLRFSTTSWNNGTGPLELVGGEVVTGSGKQKVYQRIFATDGTSYLHYAGDFAYHAAHGHIHFDDYALYTLQPVDAPGGSTLYGEKVTFCVMDTTKVNTSLPGASANPVYTVCETQVQGMSIGWGDTYGSHLPGQEIDLTGAADGIYQLKIEIDPNKLLVESNKNDNISCALIDIKRPSTVTVLDISGGCSAVSAITPSSAKAGTSVQVTIAGYGFTPGMSVNFERGNGPRPVATNVQLASDSPTLDMLTATVTVPAKKQLGKDPVWDLRVGNSLLRDAFQVTR